MFFSRLFCLLFLCIFLACSNSREQQPEIGWYWWKTVFAPDSAENAYFKASGANYLAVRLFDVDTSAQYPMPIPKGILKQKKAWPKEVNWVPVVYITRAALVNPGNLDTLAKRVANLVDVVAAQQPFTEIQWDHDWTATTRQNYFSLLHLLKQQSNLRDKQFVATVRLHQLQQVQPSMLPPVNKGLLMVYNMGHLTRAGTSNSIFDEAVWKTYLPHLSKYPLPLDWALPVFAWAVQFRQDRFVAILNGVREADLNASRLVDALPDGRFRCRSAGEINGFSVQAGDVLRLEGSNTKTLKKIVLNLRANRKDIQPNLYFFDWQKNHFLYFTPNDIQQISQAQ